MKVINHYKNIADLLSALSGEFEALSEAPSPAEVEVEEGDDINVARETKAVPAPDMIALVTEYIGDGNADSLIKFLKARGAERVSDLGDEDQITLVNLLTQWKKGQKS